jgi:mRNA deadenylase 3'-5' endonuclease subunit Ccr4
VTAEADAVLDLVLTREEVIAEMIETAAVAHQDLALTKEEIDTVEMTEIEEMVITEIEITIEKTDVILVALDLTRESAEEAEKEKDMEEEVEIVRKENRDHLSNADLRSARENNVELAEAAVSIVAREEDLPRLVVMREKPEINVSFLISP